MVLTSAFAIFYLICMVIELTVRRREKIIFLLFFTILLSLVVGCRSLDFKDTGAYVASFMSENGLSDYHLGDTSMYFGEKGFYLFEVLVRTITNSPRLYLLILSLVTLTIMARSISELSLYPLIGLCAYVARFITGRDCNQVRAALSYAILMLGVKYIRRKDWKRYFLIVFIAYMFHSSAVIAIPIYFVCVFLKPKKTYVYIGLIVSFVIGIAGQGVVHGLIEDNASDLNISNTYTDATKMTDYVVGKGIRNPMIYYQTFLLLLYTLLEKKLIKIDPNYYVIRWCYLYSTMILICLCSYAVLSGRTSTLYATLEFAIIPALINLSSRKNRALTMFGLGLVLTAIFYMYNWNVQLF